MKLSFHGADEGVTGSCHLLTVTDSASQERKILIDCGLFQGERMCSNKNSEAFGFEPKAIDAVFVTHAHIDHTGRLPRLVDQGFNGSIYFSEPSLALSRIVMEDAYRVMVENTERCGDETLYQEEDLDKVFDLAEGKGYHEQIEPFPGILVTFHDAGHILGSSFIVIKAENKTIVFSGDIGNDNVPILSDTEAIAQADYVVCESTYGNRVHENRELRTQKLKEAIQTTIRDKAVLMIPAFSVERTQEVLYEMNQILLHELKTEIAIYLDSPLAIKATQVYRDFKQYLRFDAPILSDPDRDFFSFENLHETFTRDESKVINKQKPPMIIIAGSGMMSGGRILHHLKRYLDKSKNHLLIIGYQAKGTLGRKIYEGAEKVTIYGDQVEVKAQVEAISSFSAHGDKNKLTKWLRPEDGKMPKKVFLVHGEPEVKKVFATHLRHKLETEVIIPELHSEYEL